MSQLSEDPTQWSSHPSMCVGGGSLRTGDNKREQLYEMNLDNDNDCEENKRRLNGNESGGGIQEVWSGKESPRMAC